VTIPDSRILTFSLEKLQNTSKAIEKKLEKKEAKKGKASSLKDDSKIPKVTVDSPALNLRGNNKNQAPLGTPMRTSPGFNRKTPISYSPFHSKDCYG
jgi:hypothetical protein